MRVLLQEGKLSGIAQMTLKEHAMPVVQLMVLLTAEMFMPSFRLNRNNETERTSRDSEVVVVAYILGKW